MALPPFLSDSERLRLELDILASELAAGTDDAPAGTAPLPLLVADATDTVGPPPAAAPEPG